MPVRDCCGKKGINLKGDNKTKKQLVQELTELRSQNAELKKSESAEKYQSLVEDIMDVIYELDSQGVVLYISPAIRDLLGYDSAEIVGKNFSELAHQDDLGSLTEWFSELRKGREYPSECRVIHKSGEIRWVRTNTRPIMEDALFKGARGILIDVTVQRQAEEALRMLAVRNEAILAAVPDIIVEVDVCKRYTWANQAGKRFFGEDVIGREASSYFEGEQDTYNKVQPLFNGGEDVIYIESWQRRQDGEKRLLSWWCKVLKNEQGLVIGALSTGRDITDREHAKEALRKTEELYHLVVDNMADVITVLDMNLRFTYVSPSIIRLRGYTAEEVMAQTLEQIMTPDSLQVVARVFEEELKLEASGMADPDRTRLLELEEYKKDGSIVWLDNHLSTLRDNEKKLIGIIALSHDITDRKRAEVALQESEELFRSYLEYAPDGVYMSDLEGNFLYGNRKCEEIIGYRREELVGKNFLELNILPEKSLNKAGQLLQANMEGKSTGPDEIQLIRKEGRLTPVEINTSVVQRKGQRIVLAFVRDINERKKSEATLKNTLESLRKAFGATIQVMVSATEVRDPYTAGHQLRSADLARAIATEMGLTQDRIDGIRIASSIHDIGKLSVPAEILSKPTKLSEIEFSLIKEHSLKGYEMLKDVESPWPIAQIVYQHHERMNGSGYPRNLKGDEICTEARILSVADVVEAMASHRPYRPSLGIDSALEEISKNRGILYDPEVVDTCLRLYKEKGYKFK
jgi:PAS domain S-box-containing protein